MKRLNSDFYRQDVLIVAPALLGKTLVRSFSSGEEFRYIITETEAYRGEEDLACHVSKGRTARTEVMYEPGGILYLYLIYGIYWMLNVVTSVEEDPQAVLIRGLAGISGPGRLTQRLGINRDFNRENLSVSDRIWIEDSNLFAEYSTHPRIGIDYAGEYWKNQPWRYLMNNIP